LTSQQHGKKVLRLRAALFHNGVMPNANDTGVAIDATTDKRLTELEIKASFTEDLVDHLNDLVARQQEQIALLIREVGKLKDRAPDTGGGAARDPRDELPPHY
jgi:SlyX protein